MNILKIKFKDLLISDYDTIIDVRSPSEFNLDHISGAINLPVLSDQERSLVGITYKQVSKFKARKIGATFIARNTANHLETALLSKKREWRPLIYCWRGGQRSSAFATILSEIGWRPSILNGGYKNYRTEVTGTLHRNSGQYHFILISGYTGTAKTEIIQALCHLNLQTIDLEALANHRGSIFGATKTKQPSQKLFESLLFNKLKALDYRKPIIIEAESNKIGQITIPKMIWNIMKHSPRIEIVAPLAERASYLTRQYADLTKNKEQLEEKIKFLTTQHGRKQILKWQNLSKEGKFYELAIDLMFLHYDLRYKNSQEKVNDLVISSLKLSKITENSILNIAEKIQEVIGSQ